MPGQRNIVCWKGPVREVTVREESRKESIRWGTVFWESLSLKSVHGKVSVGELSGYQFISKTFSAELL